MTKLLHGGLVWLWLAGLCAGLTASGQAGPEATPELIAVERAYEAAKARYQTNANDDAAARQFASACFDRADATTKDSARATLAREGIQVCRRWLQRAPKAAAAHYYLGMNLAQLARTKSLGALPLVKEMEKEWLATIALDPHCDYAGADRNLGLLYRDAPGFPLSIGSRARAEQCLQHAVELNPEYPENHLNLIETHLKHKPAAVAREYERLLALLPGARKRFSGPTWQSDWEDWDARLKQIQFHLPAARSN
jgi:tetratricopeptide (TPR) repeat protein